MAKCNQLTSLPFKGLTADKHLLRILLGRDNPVPELLPIT